MSTLERRHLLAVTIPAFGHIIPMASFVTKLLNYAPNLDITFIVSACKEPEVRKRSLFSMSHIQQKRVDIYPLEDGLPVDIDETVSAKLLGMMKEAMDVALKEILENMGIPAENPGSQCPIKGQVHGVVADQFAAFCGEICQKRGVPWYCFVTCSAGSIYAMLSTPDVMETAPDESFFKPQFDKNGTMMFPESFFKFFTYYKKMTQQATEIVANSFRELEAFAVKAIEDFPGLQDRPLRLIGPLLPANEESADKTEEKARISKWLKSKGDRNVVYISFGSMVFPQVEQLKKVAEALSSLGKPFIWSLRLSQQAYLPQDIKDQISLQFENPNSQLLVLPWVPQQYVLGHPAIKVFVSHCGWNSTLETISNGIPVVAWPMFGDQHPNADFLVTLKTAVKIKGTGMQTDRLITPEELVNAVREVGGWSENDGRIQHFETAQKWGQTARQALLPGGSSDQDFKQLLHSMLR